MLLLQVPTCVDRAEQLSTAREGCEPREAERIALAHGVVGQGQSLQSGMDT